MSEQKLEDFGKHIAGAKKETYFRAIDPLSTEAKSLPLSKLWNDKDIKAIEDIQISAIAHTLKSNLPTKPRQAYKLNRWLNELHNAQEIVVNLIERNDPSYTQSVLNTVMDMRNGNKAYLLPRLDRNDWKRIGEVAFYQDTNAKNAIRLAVQIDKERHYFTPKTPVFLRELNPKALIDEFTNDIKTLLKEKERGKKTTGLVASSFDIYTRQKDNTAFICYKNDRQKTPLVNFQTLAEARTYKNASENIEKLNELWTAHREYNAINKADMRNDTNRERIGQSYRDHNITPNEFQETFGVRGGQFGNWVDNEERQQMLNASYDGFMDLAKTLKIDPKAIGLNGTLNIAFGARGSGWASAHYETGEKVINLTKTRGAGSLAHEWWHALDHYLKNGDSQLTRHLHPNSTARHREIVAPMNQLVQDIHKSDLYSRSQTADDYRSNPYFSTDVEMTARAFEGYVQHELSKIGIKNDFLVNIRAEQDWQKNLNAYPYPKADELKQLGKAYTAVFDTLKEVDKEFTPTEYEPETIIHADTLAVTGADETKERRTKWGDFPPVISNGKLRELSNENEYLQAKNGDFEKSAILIKKLLKDETIQEIKTIIGEDKPIIVPILAEEAMGKNRIPQAFAYALADYLDLQVNDKINQINTAKRTDTGIYHRYVSQPEFSGEVTPNQTYLIVDDTLSVGGTIANLKGYIENNGGKVIGATVMTAYEPRTAIAIKNNMLEYINQKDGLNDFWLKEFGFGLDKLTQQEAGHLKKPTLEQIQNNVKEAQQLLNQRQEQELLNEQTKNNASQQRPLHQAPTTNTTAVERVASPQRGGSEVLQSVLESRESQETSPKLSTQNTKLDCPYAEKNQAKALGAKWDNANKTWYAPAGLDLNKFSKWLPQERQTNKSGEKLTNPSQIEPTDRLYLYTQPSDMTAIQELKAQGIVKFDLPNKVWYAHKDNAEAVKNWTTRPSIPTPEEAFADYLRVVGIRVDAGHPIFDDRPHRLCNEGSNDKNVMYQAYANTNGVPFARITNFSRGSSPENWQYPTEYISAIKNIEAVERAKGNQNYCPTPTPSIPTTTNQNQQSKQEPQPSNKQQTYDEAKLHEANLMAERSKMVVNICHVAPPSHNYLAKKQVSANNTVLIVPDSSKLPDEYKNYIMIADTPKQAQYYRANNPDNKIILQRGNLVIPQHNMQGEVRAFETIAYNGSKYALRGADKKGLVTTLGNLENGKPIIITEGYATGATLHEYTNQNKPTVVVAFGRGGLMEVAQQLREQYPDSRIYIGADNDHQKPLEKDPNGKPKINQGLEDAKSVAGAVTDTHILVPQFNAGEVGKDWNDIYVDKGADEFRRQVKEQLSKINSPNKNQNHEEKKIATPQPLDPNIIKQNYPTMSDSNIQSIQQWREYLPMKYKDEPIKVEFALSRLEAKLPDLAKGEQLPSPKIEQQEVKLPDKDNAEAKVQNMSR